MFAVFNTNSVKLPTNSSLAHKFFIRDPQDIRIDIYQYIIYIGIKIGGLIQCKKTQASQ